MNERRLLQRVAFRYACYVAECCQRSSSSRWNGLDMVLPRLKAIYVCPLPLRLSSTAPNVVKTSQRKIETGRCAVWPVCDARFIHHNSTRLCVSITIIFCFCWRWFFSIGFSFWHFHCGRVCVWACVRCYLCKHSLVIYKFKNVRLRYMNRLCR